MKFCPIRTNFETTINQGIYHTKFAYCWQKTVTDICPPFRPILSAIGTPSYEIAKFLVPKLSSITFNEFTVKDSFVFAEEIVHQDSKFCIGGLDVDSLFTNVPLEETINICTNLIYDNVDVIEGINKFEFRNLLSLATQGIVFLV